MAQRLNNLNKIIATLRTGASHYRQAARLTGVPANEDTYCTHAEVREHHAKILADIIENVGGEVQHIEPFEQVRNVWSWLTARTGQTERQLVNNLEQHEQRTVTVIRHTMEHPDNARDLDMLRDIYGDFEKTHAVMRDMRRTYLAKEGAGHDAGMAATKALPDQPDWMKAKRGATGDTETAKASAEPAQGDAPETRPEIRDEPSSAEAADEEKPAAKPAAASKKRNGSAKADTRASSDA